jgi:hypothetical protein
MTTRLMLGYGLVAFMAATALFGLWFFVLRHQWSQRRRRAQGERERIARQHPDGLPVHETD